MLRPFFKFEKKKKRFLGTTKTDRLTEMPKILFLNIFIYHMINNLQLYQLETRNLKF